MIRFGRLEANLARLWLIYGDCDDLKRLLRLNHNHIATIIGSKYDCYNAAVEMFAICHKLLISRPLWIEI